LTTNQELTGCEFLVKAVIAFYRTDV